MTTLLDTVRTTADRHRMIRRGDRVLAAVSAGPDSLALLSVLVALRLRYRLALRAVYVDHGLRPAAARREAALVRKLGRIWGVPVSVVQAGVRRRGGESLEAAARAARYRALLALARRTRCRAIAVGHTLDDQAETVLMWMLRGTGTTGLAGIPPVRAGERGIRIIRPLLRCSRQEVLEYLRQHGIRPLLDRSNLSGRFLRNRIRRELIPLLERRFNPQLRRRLAGLAEILRSDSDWLRQKVKTEFRRMARARGDTIRIHRSDFKKAHPALRQGILRQAVERLQGNGTGLTQKHWEALDQLAVREGAGAMDLPHGLRAEVPAGETKALLLRRRGRRRARLVGP